MLVRLGAASRASSDTKALGARGERVAARTLRRAGYRVVGRNVRVPVGEADLVCLAPDRRTLVFVEVKTRRVAADGVPNPGGHLPEANIHAHKRRKLVQVAQAVASLRGWASRPLRIDVVAVEWPEGARRPVVRWHENAVGLRA